MPRLQVDTTQAQKREPLPDDTYTCTVQEVTGPHTGQKSKYVTVVLKVSEGEFEGREIWHNLPIEGKGAGIFADFWQKVTGDELPYGEAGIDVDTDDLVGRTVGVVTVQEEYPEGSGTFNHKVKKLVQA